MPKRIQRKRTAGWKMPVDAVYVGRPTVFGNPWTHADTLASGMIKTECIAQVNVNEFRTWLAGEMEAKHPPDFFPMYVKHRMQRVRLLRRIFELRGRDLACYCSLDQPCHADVLLELANR